MPSANDVAAYILKKHFAGRRVTTMKLQKLVYYCQAWSLVWEDEPLFSESIEGWANGPVVRELYELHRGFFEVNLSDLEKSAGSSPLDPDGLTSAQKGTVDTVVGHYGKFNGYQLSQLTHAEEPWLEARKGLKPGEIGDRVIPLEAMAEYYGSLI